DRLKKETDTRAKDLYHIGRFSKRMALVHQEKEVSQDIAMISLNAKTFALRAALDLLPKSFSLEEACKKMLEISYLGDVRVEAFDKVEKIYKAEHIYYLHIVSQLLDTISWIQKDPSGKYTQDRIFLWSHRWKSMYFIYKSKVRSQLRWPKNMFTVEHWIDYVLAKIKRTHGLTFELTEKEKKYWYIYGWKYLFELRKKKIF
ncbi:MAG: hypothetical protein KDD52_06870, partial [Bdellovibrionales bacterium]|nr:hypothetical protein [Bdellovibrionales bacterium]